MSALPSPLKSPTLTSTQVTVVGQAVPQGEEVKAVLPLETATHHRPVCSTRPVMSAKPSPLKSPTLTSTQVTAVDHWSQGVKMNEAPVLSPTHHRPVCSTRPAMSALWSPSKSPTLTSTQVTLVGQVAQGEDVKAVLPLETATHHRPVGCTRPAMSSFLSPVKSPTFTSTQLTAVLHWSHLLRAKADPMLMPTHQKPVCWTRAAISVLPSPLKSPVITFTQVTAVDSVPNTALVK